MRAAQRGSVAHCQLLLQDELGGVVDTKTWHSLIVPVGVFGSLNDIMSLVVFFFVQKSCVINIFFLD